VAQICIVHLIRNRLAFVSWKDREAILPAIKTIYRAENSDMALVRLEEFEAVWGKRYPAIARPGAGPWSTSFGSSRLLPASANNLHHQRGRGAAPVATQDHQDPRQFPQ
jgi:hypothetical protein